MKIFGLASLHRHLGGCGGVEKFHWYLDRAIDAEPILSNDIPRALGHKDALFVVDGGHGLEIPTGFPIITVCHGTWVALWARAQRLPEEDSKDNPPYEPSQVKMFGLPNIPGRENSSIVAVSTGAQREVAQYHGKQGCPIIFNGVDVDVYTPRPRTVGGNRPVIIHVASDWRKGVDIIPKLQARLPHFDFQYLNAAIGEEPKKFARGDMFVHVSCSEGNSYACLEAMSCDLPMVVTNVGLFESDVNSSIVGRVIPYTSQIESICTAIEEVWEEREKFHPRQWIEQNATFNHFKDRWQNLIANVDKLGLTFN